MKTKFIFLLLSSLFATSVYADWHELGTSSTGTIYVDRDSLQRNGDIAKISVLDDMMTPELTKVDEGEPYLSTKEQRLVNCKDKVSVTVFIVYYAQPMGAGPSVHSIARRPKQDDWMPSPPRSVGEGVIAAACPKGRRH
jgi:hypothetical protein